MPSVLSRYRRRAKTSEERFGNDLVLYGGHQYPLLGGSPYPLSTMPGSKREETPKAFHQFISQVHRRNGLIAAAVTARALPLSQLYPVWHDPAEAETLLDHPSLKVLRRPNRGMTRQQLLWRIEQDLSYSGNAFVLRLLDGRGRSGQLRRLRPDWVSIVMFSEFEPEDVALGADVEVVGYVYQPNQDMAPRLFTTSQVAHIAPEPDPLAHYRGESWVSSLVREILEDFQLSDHLDQYLTNAATANMVLTPGPEVQGHDEFAEWVEAMEASNTSDRNRWRNMYLGHGSAAQVVGSQLAQLDLKNLTGGVESRVAARSRVPETLLGTRGGNAGSALNASTYGQSRRLMAEHFFRPYAESILASAEAIVSAPEDRFELWALWDRILFLQEDAKDQADITSANAGSMRSLVDGGFDPESVIVAVSSHDLSKLEHSGSLSVQLHPDGQALPDGGPAPAELAPAERHLPGQHDQKSHGRKGGEPLGGGAWDSDQHYTAARDFVLDKSNHAKYATDKTHYSPETGWSLDRRRAHAEIVDELFEGTDGIPRNGQAVLMGGLGGAGKTTLLRNNPEFQQRMGIELDADGNITSHLVINADDIKPMLHERGMIPDIPGLSPGEASVFVHEEASHISHMVAARASEEGMNVVWDYTMGSTRSAEGRVRDLIEPPGSNYDDVRLGFVDVTVTHSAHSARERWRRGAADFEPGSGDFGGRLVPSAIIRSNAEGARSNSRNRDSFDQLREEPWIAHSEVWNNDNFAGELVDVRTNPNVVSPEMALGVAA